MLVIRPAHHAGITKTQAIVTRDFQNLHCAVKLATTHLGHEVAIMVVVLRLEAVGVIATLAIRARHQNGAHALVGEQRKGSARGRGLIVGVRVHRQESQTSRHESPPRRSVG